MDAADESEPAFEVIDLLHGFCRLERRSPTLAGSVPLRVAQGCTPLLEGNAFGYQVILSKRVDVRRHATVFDIDNSDSLAQRLRGNVPIARARGLLSRTSRWNALLERGVACSISGAFEAMVRAFSKRGPAFTLFTGLFVRPRDGVRLRQSATKNRRSFAYSAREAFIDNTTDWTPLVLEIDVHSRHGCSLFGEVATLAALPARARLHIRSLKVEEALDVAAAHLTFYDKTYFATKNSGHSARKYRREGPSPMAPVSRDDTVALDIIECGSLTVRPGYPSRIHSPEGQTDDPPGGPPDRVVVENAVGLRVAFDGLDVRVVPNANDLKAHAARITERWRPILESRDVPAHEGALLYLTKYVTPHPAGEAHFFVKPSALVRTAPGVATLVEGVSNDAYNIMRGVIDTDRFHAAPCVFQLPWPDRPFDVPRGAALVHLFAVPKNLLRATYSAIEWSSESNFR